MNDYSINNRILVNRKKKSFVRKLYEDAKFTMCIVMLGLLAVEVVNFLNKAFIE